MAANNPLTSAIAVTSDVTTGILPSNVTGVTLLPIPSIWDSVYSNPNGGTGMWRPLVGKDGAGMFTVINDSTGTALFTSGNPGQVAVTSLPALSAGTNAIGTVGVTALPALPTGTNTIGNVGVTSLPALPAGTNTIGAVTQAGSATYDSDNNSPVTATTSSATITPTSQFQHISINNTGSTALLMKVGVGTWITIPANQSFDAPLSGSAFSHSTASGTTTFNWFVY